MKAGIKAVVRERKVPLRRFRINWSDFLSCEFTVVAFTVFAFHTRWYATTHNGTTVNSKLKKNASGKQIIGPGTLTALKGVLTGCTWPTAFIHYSCRKLLLVCRVHPPGGSMHTKVRLLA